MRFHSLVLAGSLAASTGCSSGAEPQTSLADCSGRFIVAGFRVVMTTHPDGTSSSLPDELKDDIYDGLAYGKGRVVALGIGGRVVVSNDRGATFSSPPTSSGVEPYELLFRRGRFIAVGRDLASSEEAPRALVVASDDGETWEPMSEALDGGFFEAFDASDDAIVAVGGGELGGGLYRYTDAAGWERVTPVDGPRYQDVHHDGRTFLAIAADDPATGRGVLARSSDDGRTFDGSDFEPGFVSLTMDSGRYLASGFKRVAVSDDASTFRTIEFEAPSSRPEDANDWYFYKVAHDGCDYMAVGGLMGWTATSSDGVAWTDRLGPTHGSLLEVIHIPDE
jgi:hypothetical protein